MSAPYITDAEVIAQCEREIEASGTTWWIMPVELSRLQGLAQDYSAPLFDDKSKPHYGVQITEARKLLTKAKEALLERVTDKLEGDVIRVTGLGDAADVFGRITAKYRGRA